MSEPAAPTSPTPNVPAEPKRAGTGPLLRWAIPAALIVAAIGIIASRFAPPPPDPGANTSPLRQGLIGTWDSPSPTTSATLMLNADGTFRSTFTAAKGQPPFVATGDWTIEDRTIVGVVKSVENGSYYAVGQACDLGEIARVEQDTLQLRKPSGIEVYHRMPAGAAGEKAIR